MFLTFVRTIAARNIQLAAFTTASIMSALQTSHPFAEYATHGSQDESFQGVKMCIGKVDLLSRCIQMSASIMLLMMLLLATAVYAAASTGIPRCLLPTIASFGHMVTDCALRQLIPAQCGVWIARVDAELYP